MMENTPPTMDASNGPETQQAPIDAGGAAGCLVCGKGDDHPNIPENDWFCDACKANGKAASFPTEIASRFGEIGWAQVDNEGWWPCCIQDPRLMDVSIRSTIRHNVLASKRHLIFFYEHKKVPFSLIPQDKIKTWTDGLGQSFHLGRHFQSSDSKDAFTRAFAAALVEFGKPKHQRQTTQRPTLLPLAATATSNESLPPAQAGLELNKKNVETATPNVLHTSSPKPVKRLLDPNGGNTTAAEANVKKSRKNAPSTSPGENAGVSNPSGPSATSADSLVSPSSSLVSGDTELCCSIFEVPHGLLEMKVNPVPIGFVILPSQKSCIFAHVREEIMKQIDCLKKCEWNFVILPLGPVSRSQESALGPIVPFLVDRQFLPRSLGMDFGSSRKPLSLLIAKFN